MTDIAGTPLKPSPRADAMAVTETTPGATPATVTGPDGAAPVENGLRPVGPVRRTVRRYLRSRASGWTLVALIVVFWQAYSGVHYDPTISSPDRIVETWWREATEGDLLRQLSITLRTMAEALALAVPLGVGIGFLMGRSRVIWGLSEPLVEILRLTPATAILPIYILFLGLGDQMKIAVFLTGGIFPMIINSYAGARGVSKILAETAQTYRLSWLQTQKEIALPFATPYILVGMRQSLGMSLVLAVVIGMLSGNDGIGYYLMFAQQNFNLRQLLAGVLTVAVIGYLFNAIFLLLEKRVTRWRRGTQAGEA
ncbi:ABC transporter permease [Microbispora hainanensis]|jgi:ABC-type nitrate/sulfonate/bicarbonate transport system permease component|uniref:ABC transporter permease n=1 Tax=Microbispora hainanensis TaxID=568844 RepID=A0ABZ1SFC0_9ACTN|nr:MULTISPECIES: ABC transporter permease [Microbispora]NJP26898.1 ABC transporter permease [Microbispora sp. CL1-1]TQS11817.1 ABC transporter permease [Microbispora sp. SCL1-1]